MISFIKITICELSRTVSHEFPKIQRKEFNDRVKRPINEIDRNPLTVPVPSPNLRYKNDREEKRRNENKNKKRKKNREKQDEEWKTIANTFETSERTFRKAHDIRKRGGWQRQARCHRLRRIDDAIDASSLVWTGLTLLNPNLRGIGRFQVERPPRPDLP